MNKLDYEDTSFQDFERSLIYDIEDGDTARLVKSLNRLLTIIQSLPERHTIAMWLFDKVEKGPRFGMLYWPLTEDEKPDPTIKPVTRKIHITAKQYEDLVLITCTCITDVPDGDISTLLLGAIEEVRKMHVKSLMDISFSKVGVDDLMEESTLKLYCR